MEQGLLFCSCPSAEHTSILLNHPQIKINVNIMSISHVMSHSKVHHRFAIRAFGVLLLPCLEYAQPWCAQPGALFLWQSFVCRLPFARPSQHFMSANTQISMLVGFPHSVSHTQNSFTVNIFKDLCAIYSFKIHVSKYTCKMFDKDSCPVILPKHVLFLPCPPLPVWKHLLSHLCFGRMLKNLF